LALSGNMLYSAGCSTLSVLDVTTATSPKVLSQTAATTCLKQVSVAGNIVYAVDFDGTLSVFDVSVPAQPIFIGLLPVAVPVNYVLAKDGNVFLLEDSRALGMLKAVKSMPISKVN
jgi:hypothetical protein